MPLLLIFIVVPVIELAVLIKVGSQIGVLWTLILIFLTAVVGVSLLRAQGIATLMRANRRLEEGTIPAQELAEGFLLALAGAMLITPGFVTDAFGFSLLVPGVRKALVGSVLKVLKVKAFGRMGAMGAGMGAGMGQPRDVYGQPDPRIHRGANGHDVIDGEYRRED